MNITIYYAAWTCRHVRLWVLLSPAKQFKEGLGRDEESSGADGPKTTSLQSVLGGTDIALSMHHAQLHVDEIWDIYDFESLPSEITSDVASTS